MPTAAPVSKPRLREEPKPGQMFTRSLSIESFERIRAGEEGKPDLYEYKISSDAPVEISPNEFEILGHESGEIRLDWITSGNAPMLWGHNRDWPIGIVDSARVEGGFLFVTVRFGSGELAKEKKQDWDDGILKNVSVGYRVHAWKHEREEDGQDFYRVTDWDPLEASLVTIPADRTVGAGRSYKELSKSVLSDDDKHNRTMPQTTDNPPVEPKEPKINVSEVREQAKRDERERQQKIRKASEGIKGYDLSEVAERAIEDGSSLEQFNEQAMEKIRGQAPKLSQADMGIGQKEAERYSVANVMEGLRSGNLKDVAKRELEISDEIKKRTGKGGDTVAMPIDVSLRGWIPKNERALGAIAASHGISQRDLQSVTGVGNGTVSNVVETELLDELFVYSLREESALLDAGVTMIPGLVGNVEIPVELLNPEFYWVGEDEEPTEGVYGLGKVGLNFRTLAGRVPFTRQAEKQSAPGIEALLIRSCRKGASLGLAKALYSGSGVGDVPRGILNTVGIGDVVAGGAYSRNVLVDLEVALGNSNVSGESASFTNTTSAGGFAKTPISADSDRFVGKYARGTRKLLQTEIGDIHIDNLVPDNTIIHGVPSSLLVGMWGAMELGVDTATKASTGGKVIRVFLDADCIVPQAANWAACDDLQV